MKKTGVLFALMAYTTWGLFPAFWKLLQAVPHEQLLAHRIVWSALFFAGWLAYRQNGSAGRLVAEAATHWRKLATTAALLGVNWFIYIYAVNSGYVLQASLGYFMAPLVNVALGTIVLKERLRPLRWLAMALAAIGVGWLTFNGSGFPIIAVSLALTWGVYGLVRKSTPVAPLAASAFESALLVFPALAYFPVAGATGHSPALTSPETALVVLSGAMTALPLLWFAEAASRLPLSTMGFFQYITPSLQFLLAVFAFGESFTPIHARSFGLIWMGLGLFSLDALSESGLKSAFHRSISSVRG